MGFLSIIIVLAVIRLVMGVQLYRTAQRNSLPNLYWLSAIFIANFILLCLVDLGNNPLGKLPFSYLVVSGAPIVLNALLIQFVHTTFYVGKASPQRWFWAAHLVLSIVGIYGLTQNSTFERPSPWLVGFYISGLIVWGWHTVASYTAYRSIVPDEHVENWVKVRYRLIVAYGVVACIDAATTMARVILAFAPQGLLDGLLGILAFTNFATIGLQAVVWLMPEALKRFLNRRQQTRLIHEQIEQHLSVLGVFGTAMTEGTSLKNMACLYAIRSTVEKSIGIEDPEALRAYISTMSYKDWELVFQHSELRRILINSGADNSIADKAIANARQALIDKQSLLSFGVR